MSHVLHLLLLLRDPWFWARVLASCLLWYGLRACSPAHW